MSIKQTIGFISSYKCQWLEATHLCDVLSIFVIYSRTIDGISEIRPTFMAYLPRYIKNMQIHKKGEFRKLINQAPWINCHGRIGSEYVD